MDHKPSSVDRRKFLGALGVTVGGTGLGRCRPGCRTAAGQSRDRAAQGQDSGYALQDRAHDVLHQPGGGARRAVAQGPHPGGRRDQRPGRSPGQAQDRDHHGGRSRRHRRQRQRASPHEARGQDRPVHRRHLQRQHPGARPGRRGAQPADDVRGRLHRLPVRQGRSQSEIHLPPHQHPIGGRHHGGDRRRAGLAASQEGRSPASGLQLRPQRRRALHARARAAGARLFRPCPKAGPSSAPPTSRRTSPRSCRPSRISCSPRFGAATTWPSTSRRCATACSTR